MFDIVNAFEMPSIRWLCRVRSLNAVVDQYDIVLISLENMSKTINGDTSNKAAGLLDFFQKGTTLLVLTIWTPNNFLPNSCRRRLNF